ncbi:hypothetical protein N8993_08975 [Pseudomonadales bacterium]|nr:hypothetical protein [Pseudomonadales bacterium]MDB2542856.1 hypothetical protein [Pseudomonadales bacterium]
MTERTVAYLVDSFELLSTLYIECDKTETLQLSEIAIEIESTRALELRAKSNIAISKQLEIKLLAVDRLIIKRVAERLAYYALPEEIEGQNENGLLAPELTRMLRKHYQLADVWDEDFQLREALAKILALVDEK